MSDTTAAVAELAASDNLRSQIEQLTNFSGELVGGGSVKKIMAESHAKSADLWQVPPEEIYVLPGYNPRVHNRAYYEGIAALGQNMARDGYMQDKPLAVYIAKIDGKDQLVLQDGHRRHGGVLYAKNQLAAPIKTVPIVIKPKSDDQASLLKAMLHANESTPFTVYEKAIIAKRFKSFGWTDKQIAEEMGCTTAYVGQMLSMAGAPQAIQELVDAGQMSATEALEVVKQHGEEAVNVATAAVKRAQSQGRQRATGKDVDAVLSPAEERNAQKTRNAKRVAFDLYKVLVALTKDEAVMKKVEDKLIEKIDALIATVEKMKVKREPAPPKPKKEPKPIKVKAVKAAKTPAKKAAGKKGAPKFGTKEFFDAQQSAKESRAGARGSAVGQRRSER